MQETGPADGTVSAVERARLAAEANFQLLAMLEVVQEWMRSDAVDLAEAAEQMEAVTAMLERLSSLDFDGHERTLTQEQILKVLRKLDRLTQLATVQSRSPVVVNAVLEGLRRLRVAHEAAQGMLELRAPQDEGGSLPAPDPNP